MSASPSFKPFPEKWDLDSVTEHVIVHYRWVFVMFLLPVSLCYDVYSAVRSWIVFQMNSAPTKHLQKVKEVQRQVRHWKDSGISITIFITMTPFVCMGFCAAVKTAKRSKMQNGQKCRMVKNAQIEL